MRATARLGSMRARVAALCTDTCRITLPAPSKGPVNQQTGKHDQQGTATTIYEGPSRFPKRPAGTSAGATATGGPEARTTGEYDFALPFDAEGADAVRLGMVVEILTSEFMPSMVGRKFGVVADSPQSQATVRRFKVKEAVR